MSNGYKLALKLVELGRADGLADKLDVLLLAGRMTRDEYNTVMARLSEVTQSGGES